MIAAINLERGASRVIGFFWGGLSIFAVLPLAVPPLRPSLSRSWFKYAPDFNQDDERMWEEVLARFEKKAPASVMAKRVLEHAIPADWVNQVFETHRQRQYPRELLFSTVVELMSLVSLGLRPSLHAAARKMED